MFTPQLQIPNTMPQQLSATEAISKGYDLFKARFLPLFLFSLFTFLTELLLPIIFGYMPAIFGSFTYTITDIISNLISLYLALLLIRKMLEYYNNPDVDLSIGSFFSTVNLALYVKYLLASILAGIVVAIPVGLLIGIGFLLKHFIVDVFIDTAAVPAILTIVYLLFSFIVMLIISTRVYMTPFYIADNLTDSPIVALELSFKHSKNNVLNLIGFFILAAMLAILGVICLLVGILFVYPIIMLATVHAYKTLNRVK